jgi:hypothetical protein
MQEARVKRARTLFQEAKRLGVDPFELNQAEWGRKSLQEVLDESRLASAEQRKSWYYGEIYVGCGERKDGRWNVIVVPPAGENHELRVVQTDLDLLEAAEIAGRLRKQVHEHPQAALLSADELLKLCVSLLNLN